MRDVASGTDRYLDITFGLQVVERSSLVSVLFYISFFHLLVNGFSDIYIGECGSTLYVGLSRIVWNLIQKSTV